MVGSRGGVSGSALTDLKLAERFGVSRITVRRAVDELVDAGVLYRIRGVGTFVRPRKLRERLTLESFLDTSSGGEGRIDVRVGAFEHTAADEEMANRLSASVGEPLIYIRRLRYQRGTLIAVDDRFLRSENCRLLTAHDITTSSLVDFLRNREKIKLVKGEMDIEARSARNSEARLLKIAPGKPILVRRVTFYDAIGRPILVGSSTYRANRVTYRFTVSA